MQDYNTIIGAIQMRLNGCQTRSVMDRYKIGSGTLNLIMSRYHAGGIPIEELRMMAPKEVENLFYPQKNLQRKDAPLPDFQYYYDRIHAPGSRMNISFCWLDYKEKNPDGYEKSQFYEYFNRFIAENYGGQKVSMAVNRIPGEKMYIDWVGDQPELLTDTETGEIKKVHIFATTLGVSNLIYAEAFPNEKLPCFIEGCAHAVSFYGAVAKYFVPDNLKTAVTKHTKDELILQSTFADLEDFYETIVLPPPARKPKGIRDASIAISFNPEKIAVLNLLTRFALRDFGRIRRAFFSFSNRQGISDQEHDAGRICQALCLLYEKLAVTDHAAILREADQIQQHKIKLLSCIVAKPVLPFLQTMF